jgi:hypothetical protein
MPQPKHFRSLPEDSCATCQFMRYFMKPKDGIPTCRYECRRFDFTLPEIHAEGYVSHAHGYACDDHTGWSDDEGLNYQRAE